MAELETLFDELDELVEASYEDEDVLPEVVQKAEEILKVSPGDKDALKCKVVALIQNQSYLEALKFLTSTAGCSDFVFERVYCQYRLAKWDDALQGIKKLDKDDIGAKNLRAQVLYRCGQFSEAARVFEDVDATGDYEGDDDTAIKANTLAAATFCPDADKKLSSIHPAVLEETHELSFNAACCALELGQLDKAREFLSKARDKAQEEMEDDEDDDELKPIDLQLSYLAHREGKLEEAGEGYNRCLQSKPSDVTLVAVAGNNLVATRGEKDLFDSSKRLKSATSDAAKMKLTPAQNATLATNNAILLFFMNKLDQCQTVAESLGKEHPSSDVPPRLLAALCHKAKNTDACLNALTENVDRLPPANAAKVNLTKAQVHILNNDHLEAVKVLQGMGEVKYMPGICSAVVHLYTLVGDIDSAVKALSAAINHWEAADKSEVNQERLKTLLRCSADFNASNGRHSLAAGNLEKLVSLFPRDLAILAKLIISYSKFDPDRVSKLETQLPAIEGEDSMDVLQLESLPPPRQTRWEKMARDDGRKRAAGETGETEMPPTKRKAKKKKKIRLPKNFDPEAKIDPERWLPLKERSYYKKSRRQKAQRVKGGAQGKVSEQEMERLDKRLEAERLAAEKEKREKEEEAAKAAKDELRRQKKQQAATITSTRKGKGKKKKGRR